MKDVIVIPTHISGVEFLKNLLYSFNGYKKYPILIVINESKKKQIDIFRNIQSDYGNLPISLQAIKGNYYEYGGIWYAYKNTDYDNFLLLPHSCEIVNTEIFDVVFEKYKEKSVAFCLHKEGAFWISFIGKYRREILGKMDLNKYLPVDMWEICDSEIQFTTHYHQLDNETVVLFKDWNKSNMFENKYGRKRMKIANEYIIKWKTRWNREMILDDMSVLALLRKSIRDSKKRILWLLKKIYEKASRT